MLPFSLCLVQDLQILASCFQKIGISTYLLTLNILAQGADEPHIKMRPGGAFSNLQ
jgi:hypothetical protein